MLPRQRLADQVRHGVRDARLVVRQLAGPVGVEGPADRVRQAVLVVQRETVFLAGELREAVGRPRRRALVHVALRGRELGRVLEHHRGRHVHQALDRLVERRPEDRVVEAVVHLEQRVREPVEVRDAADDRREVDHVRAARHRRARAWRGRAGRRGAPRSSRTSSRAPRRWSETRTVQSPSREQPPHHGRADRAGAACHEDAAHSAVTRSCTMPNTAPEPVTFHGSTTQRALGQPLEQALERGVVRGHDHRVRALEHGVERLGVGRHVRVVARHVRQLALEHAHELVGERVAHVVGVALEGEPEHGDLQVAQRAAQPRLQPLDHEQRHGLVHPRHREQHARARSSAPPRR